MSYKAAIILSFLSGIHLMDCLIAYHCGGSQLNKTTISLIDRSNCITQQQNITSSERRIILTQAPSTTELSFNRCLVVLRHNVFYCGIFSNSNQEGGYYTEVLSLTKTECNDLINDRVFHAPKEGTFMTIYLPKDQNKYSYSYTSWGSIHDASCSPGGDLVVGDKRFLKATRSTEAEVTFARGTARLDIEQKNVIFPNGMRCDYEDESCILADYGTIYWDKIIPKCDNEFDNNLVFEGTGTYIEKYDESIEKYIQVNHNGYDFQILIKDKFSWLCGYKTYHTEHPQLFITYLEDSGPRFPKIPNVSPTNINLMNYINSKLVYSMRHVKQEVNKLFHLFEEERCSTLTKIHDNMRTLAIISPAEFAFQYFGEGYSAVTRGEVIHIAQCTPVEVIPRRHNDQCFNELPVDYKNKTFFMVPRSRMLISVGTIVDCSSAIGSYFKLNGLWYMNTELGLTQVLEPAYLKISKIKYHFQDLNSLDDGGIYTNEEIMSMQKIMISPMEESVIKSRVIKTLSGPYSLPTGYTLSNGFSRDDINVIKRELSSFWDMIDEKARFIGSWAAFVIVTFFGIKFIKSIMESVINFRFLKETVGLGKALLFCCCNGLTHHLINQRPTMQPPNLEAIRAQLNV